MMADIMPKELGKFNSSQIDYYEEEPPKPVQAK